MTNSDAPAPNEDILRDVRGVEFPDWNGMKLHRSRLTFEQAVHWNDQMLSRFPPIKSRKLEAKRRCYAEFVL